MSQAYFLFPGLLLPEEARPHLSTETLAVADRLSSAVKGNVVRQTLVAGPFAGSVHLAWVWQVVTRRPLPFSSAPFAWLIDDGPDLTSEIWSLTCFTTENGRPADIALTDDTVENLAVLLRRPLEERGFTLQRWDKTFYLTRQTGWGVVAPEWPVIRAGLVPYDSLAPLPEADASVLPGALDDLHELNRLLAAARLTDAEGRPITGLAVTGGGCQQRFNPPTKIRSVLADTPFIRSWAQESGILNHRTGRVTGTTVWPEDAPAGDVVAVVDALYEPWLNRNWTLWSQRLPDAVNAFETLAAASKKKNCTTALIVACGMTDTVTLTAPAAPTSGLLARLTQKRLPAVSWLFE